MTRVVLAGCPAGASVSLIDFSTPASPSLTAVAAGLGAGCTVDLSGRCGVIGSSGGATVRGINVSDPGSPDLGPIVSTSLGQIAAVAVQGANAAAGQRGGGQVALIDLAAGAVVATVSTALSAIGSVGLCSPTLVVAAGPDDDVVAVIDFSGSPPSVSYLSPAVGSGVTADGNAGLIAAGAPPPNSPVVWLEPTGWAPGSWPPWGLISPIGTDFVGLTGRNALGGTAAGADAYLADFMTGVVTSFNAQVGSGVIVDLDPADGTSGVCGGLSSSTVALFDLTSTPPTLLGTKNAGLPSIGSIAVASFPGAAGPAAAAWTPAALAFGAVVTGTAGALALSVTNSGGTALKAGITSSSAAFVPGLTDVWIPAGLTYAIPVSFKPAGAASYSGSLTLQTNDPANPTVTVPLSGSGSQPAGQATWQPASVSLGAVQAGTTSTAGVSITNPGTGDLGVTNISTSASPWTASPGTLTVHAGQTGTVQVSFHPGAAANYQADLTFQTSDPRNATASITLTGSGVAPAGRATWHPTGVDFGTVPANSTVSVPNVLWMRNTGIGDLGVTNVTWPPECTPDAASAGPFTIAAGDAISMGVTFSAPIFVSSWSGTLTFNTTDPNNPAVAIGLQAEIGPLGCSYGLPVALAARALRLVKASAARAGRRERRP